MSEQGWQEFLAAEGVEDWVVLHGGATPVFRLQSLGDAARVAAALAAGGRIVDHAEAPAGWILADHAGNRVCIGAWPRRHSTWRAGVAAGRHVRGNIVDAPRRRR